MQKSSVSITIFSGELLYSINRFKVFPFTRDYTRHRVRFTYYYCRYFITIIHKSSHAGMPPYTSVIHSRAYRITYYNFKLCFRRCKSNFQRVFCRPEKITRKHNIVFLEERNAMSEFRSFSRAKRFSSHRGELTIMAHLGTAKCTKVQKICVCKSRIKNFKYTTFEWVKFL